MSSTPWLSAHKTKLGYLLLFVVALRLSTYVSGGLFYLLAMISVAGFVYFVPAARNLADGSLNPGKPNAALASFAAALVFLGCGLYGSFFGHSVAAVVISTPAIASTQTAAVVEAPPLHCVSNATFDRAQAMMMKYANNDYSLATDAVIVYLDLDGKVLCDPAVRKLNAKILASIRDTSEYYTLHELAVKQLAR